MSKEPFKDTEVSFCSSAGSDEPMTQEVLPAIANVKAVYGPRFVPHGDREGRPYLFVKLKNGGSMMLYGDYLEGSKLERIAAAANGILGLPLHQY